ncbi:hypothetical protein [Ornithinimicrobium sufpigmenti]|uniref:hypothetical protein n=1 Tax=Ornithinimicrobium sufpigmenti TaxID=2508882 RepID=UPI0010358736|nr:MULTISPECIES: hypothetical protein [unclassified Ornithinimicrobium]
MSDQSFEDQSDETRNDGFGTMDRTEAEEETAQINLEEPSSTDDVPWNPPDKMPIHSEFGDDREEETIDQRIAQEVPEEGTAYGAPEPEGILGGADDLSGEGVDGTGPTPDQMLGGDDPDAVPADEDVLDSPL